MAAAEEQAAVDPAVGRVGDMGISRWFLLAVALLIAAVVAVAAAEEQTAVDPAVAREIAVGIKEVVEAAALRAELAHPKKKIPLRGRHRREIPRPEEQCPY